MDKGLNDLAEPLPVNIYRIIQESITNIAKHAQAKHAHISIKRSHDQVLAIKVTDDGIAETDIMTMNKGMGLLGINERVKALGGSLSIASDHGFSLSIELPIPSTTDVHLEEQHEHE
jgi:signal transduction histidine kinase